MFVVRSIIIGIAIAVTTAIHPHHDESRNIKEQAR